MPLAKATRQHIDKVADSAATLQLAAEEAARRLTAPVIARASDKLVAGVAVMPLETRSQVMRAAARSIREAQVQLQQEFGAAVLEARSIAAHFASRQLALEAEPLGAEAAHALALTPALPASEVEAMWAQQAGASMARRFGSLAIAETMAAHAKGRGGPGILRALGRVHQRLEPERKLHAVTQSVGAFNEAKREGWNQLNKGLAKARPALPSGGSRAGRRAGGAGGDNGLRDVWSAILDARTCPVCWKLDGQMVRPGESFPEDAKAPLHGHCRCTVITIHIPVELERYLPGAELDYDALKDDIKAYMGSRSFDVGTGVRHAQRYVDDVLKQRGHSPVVLTERVNNRRDYFPNIARPTAPSLRW